MIVYADASAIVRPYLREPFREETIALLLRAEARVTHAFSYVEVISAFAKARRMGRITVDDMALVREKFDQDWLSFDRVNPDEATARRAAALVERFELRATDAVHLAAAERACAAVSASSFYFASFDVRQSRAALRLGLRLPDFMIAGD